MDNMTNRDFRQEAADVRQQVLALASITGVLIAALRKGGLMTANLETLVASDLAAAAGAQSEQARPAWDGMIAAVLKVAAAAGAETG
jgi:hypothetical protein